MEIETEIGQRRQAFHGDADGSAPLHQECDYRIFAHPTREAGTKDVWPERFKLAFEANCAREIDA